MTKYGWKKDPLDIRDYNIRRVLKAVKIPSKNDFSTAMPAVRNQGTVGSCVGFASSYMKNYQEVLECSHLVVTSPKFIYYEGRKLEGRLEEEGMYIRTAMDILKDLGVPTEESCPYNDGNDINVMPTGDTLSALYKEALKYRVASYVRLDTIDDIKQTLALNIPVVLGIPVFENWEDLGVMLSGRIPMPNGDCIGGHAITLCGYDNCWLKRRFVFENSWGTDWASLSIKPGFGTIPYGYVEQFLESEEADAWSSVDMILSMQKRGKA